jgi:hypothetical protein
MAGRAPLLKALGKLPSRMRENAPQFDSFPTTRWSLILRNRDADQELRRQALDELLTRYYPALWAHLVQKKRIEIHAAEDVLQGFIADKILDRDLLLQADPAKGRFRALLLRSLENYLIDQGRHARARSPSTGPAISLDEGLLDRAPSAEPVSDPFDVAWARRVLAEAISRLRSACASLQEPHTWDVFESRILNPALQDLPPPPYSELVRRYCLATPKQASNLLITARRRFAQAIRSVVAEYVDRDEEIDEEIASLRQVLAGAHGDWECSPLVPPSEAERAPSAQPANQPADLEQTSPLVLAKMLQVDVDRDALWPPADLGALFQHLCSLPLAQACESLDGNYTAPPASFLAGKDVRTVGELLSHPQAPLEALAELKRLARNSARREASDVPSEIATLLYFASNAAALVHHGQRITKSGDEVLRYGFGLVRDRPWLDERMRSLLDAALVKLAPADEADHVH